MLAHTHTDSSGSSQTFHYTFDLNGNVSEVLDETGSIAAHYEYGPFGEFTREFISSNSHFSLLTFNFSTKYHDRETGLLYYGHRYYDPTHGRWINRDPMEESGGLNLYGFVGNDGIGTFDYLGMCDVLAGGVLTSGVKGVASGALKTYLMKRAAKMLFKGMVTAIPVVGQLAGGGMLAWEIYSAGKTIGHIMANQDAIFEQVNEIYHDPDLRMWFDCIPQADCEELSFQLGEVLGSALVNRKDLKSNILKARTKVKDFVRKLFKGGGKKKALSRLNDSDTVKPATEPNVDPTDVGPGSATKGTPSSIARSWQGNGKYPGQDTFKDITLKKGKIIYGGVPGQSEFYTTTSGVMRSGGSAEKLYQGLQVAQSDDQYFNPVTGLYRSCVGAYEVLEDAPAAFGRAIANPHHGDGGFPQIFVENYQSVLKLIYVIPLEP